MAEKPKKQRRRSVSRRLNVKLLLIITAVVVVATVAIYGLHSVQVARQADQTLKRAEELREEGELGRAVVHLRRYVQFVPDDTDALETLGQILEERSSRPRDWLEVFDTYEQVLRQDASRDDVRRRQVDVAMRLGRFSDARDHLDLLLDSAPQDGELHYEYGLCHEAEGNTNQAAERYQSAIQHGYQNVEPYALLASLLRRRLDKPKQADEVIEQMIDANSDSHEAYLARAEYRREFGSLQDAVEDVRRARILAPQDVAVAVALAQLTIADQRSTSEDLEEVRQLITDALQEHPDDSRLYRALSQIELRRGKGEAAVAALRSGERALPDDQDLSWLAADMLISEGKLEAARREIQRLRSLDMPRVYLNHLRARVLLEQGDPLSALELLTKVHDSRAAARNPQLLRLARLQIAACHGAMGNFDEQLAVYREVVENDPFSVEGRLGVASALVSLGRNEDALGLYRQLMNVPGVPIRVAQLLFERNLRLPDGRQDWQEVENAIAMAAETAPESLVVDLLKADVLLVRGNREQAGELLQRLAKENPQQLQPLLALARLSILEQDWERASQQLESAEQQMGDSPELRITRAQYWSVRGGAEALEALGRLAQDAAMYSPRKQAELFEGLAVAHLRLGDLTGANVLWERVAVLRPDNVRTQLRLLTLALRLDDEEAAERVLDELRRIEGAEGPHARAAEAIRLILQSEGQDKTMLSRARTLLEQVAGQRPGWDAVPLNLGRIDELQGDVDAAVENYKRAIELGNRDLGVLRRTVQLLLAQRRYAEADALMQRIQAESPASVTKRIRQLAAEALLSSLDFERALSAAEEAVSKESSDPLDQVWLGQVLIATGKPAEGERSLRKAIELDPTNAGAHAALVLFLARGDRLEEARAAVEAAETSLPPDQASPALAICFEAIEKFDLAEENYRAALDAEPGDPRLARNLAAFYLRTSQPHKAEPMLKRLVQAEDGVSVEVASWARRSLAMAIAQQGYPRFQEALAMLDSGDEKTLDWAINQRVKARLLATQPYPKHLSQAAEILEKLDHHQSLQPQDLHLLAGLLDAIGEMNKADERWRALIETNQRNPVFLAGYIQRLLNNEQLEEAGTWLRALRDVQPDGFHAVALGARMQVLQGAFGEAIEELDTYIAKAANAAGDRGERTGEAAVLLANLASRQEEGSQGRKLLNQAAERHFSAWIGVDSGAAFQFAAFLGRQERVDEALDLCQTELAGDSALAATGTAIAVLRGGSPSEEQIARVEEWLEEVIKQQPGSLTAYIQLADLRDLQRRYDAAVLLHRRILEHDRHNMVSLNNLAWLLSVYEKQHEEARRLIELAIETSGPVPTLLDTRGTVLLNGGRAQQAIEVLRESVAQQDVPATRFHLAQAYLRSDNERAAAFNLRKAEDAGLDIGQLHPLERDAYRELRKNLGNL